MSDASSWVPLVTLLSLAAATLISEDLTCIGAGALVAAGTMSFPLAVTGCLLGIVSGDVVLMLGGRWLGRRGLRTPLVQRVVGDDALARGSRWIHERGAAAVMLSRFVPGTRLATYVAAGALGMGLRRFTLSVAMTALLWVPALVGLSTVLGANAIEAGLLAAGTWVQRAVAAVIVLGLALWTLGRTAAWERRRRLFGRMRRLTRWEFWPMWVFYPPLVVYILYLGLRHRSLTVFASANPGIPGGGFIGESKFEILRRLGSSGLVARASLVPADATFERRLQISRDFMDRERLTFPIVVKPDVGQRGSGVSIVRNHAALGERLAHASSDLIVQEFVPGVEFGVFYYRRPSERRGRILSLTEKRFPEVRGDGRSTLERLILAGDRTVCQARLLLRAHRPRLSRVLAAGESMPLVEIGSHCRGALFLDAAALVTPALERAVDRLAQEFDGFYFGRFDVRSESVEAFRRGEFRVLELNGVTSESTHIYDPRHGLLTAYRDLARQWRVAFDIGAANVRDGAPAVRLVDLASMVLEYRRRRCAVLRRIDPRLRPQETS